MKSKKGTIVFGLFLIMALTLLPITAQAASTKNVYVVSNVKVKEGSTTTSITLTYNSNGLLKKIETEYADENISESFTYNKKNLLTKYVEKILTGEHKGTTNTRQYKYKSNGQRKSMSENGGEAVTYTYNSKNQITKEAGEYGSTKFTYHSNGHVKKTTSDNMTYSASFDKKGNIIKWNRKFKGEKIGYGTINLTYNSAGRVKTLTKTAKANPMAPEKKRTLTFTYTKMKVPKSLAAAIADQQWQYINGEAAVGFAW